LHELEASIGKALKIEAIVNYASALIKQQMGAACSPRCLQGEKKCGIKKDHHPIYILGKMVCTIF
jgi:hypothetical protein